MQRQAYCVICTAEICPLFVSDYQEAIFNSWCQGQALIDCIRKTCQCKTDGKIFISFGILECMYVKGQDEISAYKLFSVETKVQMVHIYAFYA